MMTVWRHADWRWLGFGALWLAVCAVEWRRRRKAGGVLLDFGGIPERWHCWIAGALLMAASMAKFFTGPAAQRAGRLSFLAMGLCLITIGARRYQLREAGILRGGKFVPWERIAGYELSPIGPLFLTISGGRVLFCCDVPPALRARAGELLAANCRGVEAMPVS